MIDVGATINANSVIQGPVLHRAGMRWFAPMSHIHSGTSIGPMCKVGGEISASIFLGYSNKAHDGFVGHSYIGEWVNLERGLRPAI